MLTVGRGAIIPPTAHVADKASERDSSRKSGANTVSGIATMKAGDTTHTCEGQAANLVPDSAYARARMKAIFGNDTRGTRASAQGPVKFDRDDPLYVSTLRRTTCDASGSFSFPRVPDGVWYVTTSVKWNGGRPRRGRLDDEAGGRAGREAGEGDVALKFGKMYAPSFYCSMDQLVQDG